MGWFRREEERKAGRPPQERLLVITGIVLTILGLFVAGGLFAVIDLIIGYWLLRMGVPRKGFSFIVLGILLFIYTAYVVSVEGF
jgi:hypothetical protein